MVESGQRQTPARGHVWLGHEWSLKKAPRRGPDLATKKVRESVGLLLTTGPNKRKERRQPAWDREGG